MPISRRDSRCRVVAGSRVARLLALLVVLVVALPVAVVAQERDPAELVDELDDAQQREEQLSDELEQLRDAIEVAHAQLSDIEARLIDARARLELLDGQVALGEVALDDAVDVREVADANLEAAEELLASTEAELAAQQRTLEAQVAMSFKYGSATQGAMALELLRQAQDVGDVATSMYKLGAVLDHQDTVVEEVERLRAQREELRDRTARNRREAAQAASDATTALDTLAQLRADAQVLTEQIAADQARQQEILDSLEADAADKEALLADVRADSETLAAELRDARERAGAALSASGAGSAYRSDLDLACPVVGAVVGWDFINDWGFPRSGGRSHQGTDVFAARGTPVVAVADATVKDVSRADRGLGGRIVSYVVDDGSYWYAAHLDTVADGIAPGVSVEQGEQIGTVGNSGNARTTPPHLHIGHYLGSGGAVNPYSDLAASCR